MEILIIYTIVFFIILITLMILYISLNPLEIKEKKIEKFEGYEEDVIVIHEPKDFQGMSPNTYDIKNVAGTTNEKYIIFKKNTSVRFPVDFPNCQILIVGGGGGGGFDGGGGGGGGQVLYYTNDNVSFKSGNAITLNAGTYNINIGNGGIGSIRSGSITTAQAVSINGTNGATSSIVNASTSATIVSAKGGAGGGSRNNVGNGGDVGGAGGNGHANSGASQVSNNGGGSGGTNNGDNKGGGGGGGGANTSGTSKNGGNNQTSISRAGNGGAGVDINISGTSVGYGGGGGGGSWTYEGGKATHGGGNGNIFNNNGSPSNGTPNTGGGGGSGGHVGTGNPSGMNGGSGVVIIRYTPIKIEPPPTTSRNASITNLNPPSEMNNITTSKQPYTYFTKINTMTKSTNDFTQTAENEDDINYIVRFSSIGNESKSPINLFSYNKFIGNAEFGIKRYNQKTGNFDSSIPPVPIFFNIKANDGRILTINNSNPMVDGKIAGPSAKGDWISIKFPSAFALVSYSFVAILGWENKAPGKWTVLGRINNTNLPSDIPYNIIDSKPQTRASWERYGNSTQTLTEYLINNTEIYNEYLFIFHMLASTDLTNNIREGHQLNFKEILMYGRAISA
jgi:hypothetical protein